MEYNVELLSSTVKKLSISVNVNEECAFQIESEHSASVFEPNDETDPTVLVRAECTIRDNSGQKLSVSMTTDFIFKFDPIPENRAAAASEYCPSIIGEESKRIAVTILKDMGHEFAIG